MLYKVIGFSVHILTAKKWNEAENMSESVGAALMKKCYFKKINTREQKEMHETRL